MFFLWVWILVTGTYRRWSPAAGAEAFNTGRAAIGGVITLIAYLLILTAFSVAPLTAVAPLRESAIVIASAWGALRLREAGGDRAEAARRIGASALVVAGSILLALDG